MNTKTLFQVIAAAAIVIPAGIALPRLIAEDSAFRNKTQQPTPALSEGIDELHARRAKFMAEPPVNTDSTQLTFPAATVPAASVAFGRHACAHATKLQFRDPDSFQHIAFDDVGDGSAVLTFRSRNGFGGYAKGAAVCTAEGGNVRSVLL